MNLQDALQKKMERRKKKEKAKKEGVFKNSQKASESDWTRCELYLVRHICINGRVWLATE